MVCVLDTDVQQYYQWQFPYGVNSRQSWGTKTLALGFSLIASTHWCNEINKLKVRVRSFSGSKSIGNPRKLNDDILFQCTKNIYKNSYIQTFINMKLSFT